VAHDRNHVTLCGENDGFNHALAALLADMEVSIETQPSPDADTDVLVWYVNDVFPRKELGSIAREIPTLVVTDQTNLLDAVDLGVRGFLPTGAPLDEVRDAVQVIIKGGAVVPPELLGALLRHIVTQNRQADHVSERIQGLTERELQVYELAATGARKDEIGERLFISSATARTHLERVYRKLGVHSQAELIAMNNARPTRHGEGGE
jgi:DNA-binding NarL/FixJ family response regulator